MTRNLIGLRLLIRFVDRLMAYPEWTPDSILVAAAKYVGVISFQPMGKRVPIRSYVGTSKSEWAC
jgi:hypothetical protein